MYSASIPSDNADRVVCYADLKPADDSTVPAWGGIGTRGEDRGNEYFLTVNQELSWLQIFG